MATGETERVLQGEGDSCECMVSPGSKRSFLGLPCSGGESNLERNLCCKREKLGAGTYNLFLKS